MNYERTLVTPAMAQQWLESHKNVRSMRRWRVTQYERQLLAGNWHETHQGIAFDTGGNLVDGQHRLQAIANSGVAAVLWVARGLSPDALLVLDQQQPRSIHQNLSIAGIECSRDMVATVKVIHYGYDGVSKSGTRTPMSTDEAKALLDCHSEAIAFAMEIMPTGHRRGSPGYLRGLLGRASYSADHDQLRAFSSVLITGDSSLSPNPATRAVIMLRDILISSSNEHKQVRQAIYLKANRALKAFVDGESLTKLYAANGDLFEVPSEAPSAISALRVAR
jgi:hypothetical protein